MIFYKLQDFENQTWEVGYVWKKSENESECEEKNQSSHSHFVLTLTLIFCYPTWIRTKTNSTKNCCATITPSGKLGCKYKKVLKINKYKFYSRVAIF